MSWRRQIFGILCAISIAGTANAGSILCLVGMATPAEQAWSNVLFKALANNGHQLTVVGPHTTSEAIPNISLVHLERTEHIYKEHNLDQKYNMGSFQWLNAFKYMLLWYERQLPICKGMLASKGFKEIVELGVQRPHAFDLILYDATNAPRCLLSLAQLFPDVPIVGLSLAKMMPDLLELAGGGTISPTNVPYFTADFSPDMNYWQRLYNTALYASGHFLKHYVVHAVQKSMIAQQVDLRNAHVPPTIDDLQQRIKLLLVNSHAAIEHAQPLPPNIVEVGGLQFSAPQPLPSDLAQLIEQAAKGAIYIALETHEAPMEKEHITSILNIVKQRPEYVFFWETTDATIVPGSVPTNLRVLQNGLLRTDILAQQKTKAFVARAHSLNLQQAVYYGLPIIAVPTRMDEFQNAQLVVDRGFGVRLDWQTFTVATFHDALSLVLSDSIYEDQAARAQLAFRNRPQKPLDTAVWWIEQLLAQPGSCDHLKSAHPVSYFVAHSFDVAGAVLLLLVMMFVNGFIVVKQTLKSFRGKKKTKPELDAKMSKSEKKKSKETKVKKN